MANFDIDLDFDLETLIISEKIPEKNPQNEIIDLYGDLDLENFEISKNFEKTPQDDIIDLCGDINLENFKISENSEKTPQDDIIDLCGAANELKSPTLDKVKKIISTFIDNKKDYKITAEKMAMSESTLKKYIDLRKLPDEIIVLIDSKQVKLSQEIASKLLQTKFAAKDYLAVVKEITPANAEMRKEILRQCAEKKISTITGLQNLVAEIQGKFVAGKIVKQEKQKKLFDEHPFIYSRDGYKLEIVDECEKEILEIIEKYYAQKYGAASSIAGVAIAAGATGASGESNAQVKNFIKRTNIISAEMLKKFLE